MLFYVCSYVNYLMVVFNFIIKIEKKINFFLKNGFIFIISRDRIWVNKL